MKPIVRQVKLRSPYSPWYLTVVLSTPEIKRVRPVAIPCSGVQKNYLVGSYAVVGFHLVGRTEDLTLAERRSVFGTGSPACARCCFSYSWKNRAICHRSTRGPCSLFIGRLQRAAAGHRNPPYLPSGGSI